MIAVAMVMQSLGLSASGVAGAVPVIAGAFFAGARHGERTGGRPAPGFSWRFAILATLIAAAISLLTLGVMTLVLAEGARQEVASAMSDPVTLTIVAVVLLAVHVLILRFPFPVAASYAIRVREKRNRAG
jgi:hypothetical protein